MTKLTGAALDRAVAHAMGLKSVHNCEGWGKIKLYDVPRNSTIVLKEGIELKFHHIDGMYSVCTVGRECVPHRRFGRGNSEGEER